MIAASMARGDQALIMLVLEPGNIEKLERGEPIHKWLNEIDPRLPPIELLIAYTPDAEWVAQQVGNSKDTELLAQVLEDSLSRPKVLVRGKSAEEMRKVT